MSISIGKKIRMIRESEYFTREQFSDLTGIPVSSQKFYETGRIENVGSETLLKITLHPKLAKYTLWLMTGKIAPESGQIEPSASSTYKVLEKEEKELKLSSKQIGDLIEYIEKKDNFEDVNNDSINKNAIIPLLEELENLKLKEEKGKNK